jgi:type IV pilus assembly protein PilV
MGQLTKTHAATSAPPQRRPRNRGVSLIEVMIALAVLGFGMLGVAAIQISALRQTDQSRERTLAQGLAQQQLEIFQEMSDASLQAVIAAGPNDPLNPIDPDPNDAQQMFFNRSWTITPDTPEDDVYRIVVTVAWNNARGAARQVQLETFKSEL